MTYSPLTIKRRNILGTLYNQCDSVTSIPVYIEAKTEEPVGFADESLGRYADAFVFHLPEEVCKKLSTGSYELFFDVNSSKKTNRIQLNYIVLVARQLPVAVPRRNAHTLVK